MGAGWSVGSVGTVLGLFVAAGLAEIGGGWMVWASIREGKRWYWALGGVGLLVAYGFIPTLQPQQSGDFGRVYAAYGAWFILLSLLWAWAVEGQRPDRADLGGAALAVVGAMLITFLPRDAKGDDDDDGGGGSSGGHAGMPLAAPEVALQLEQEEERQPLYSPRAAGAATS
mmetsp:Transcript_8890/g.32770  ORF Transcript_8890/g.32770 Transcript_8890/m.32770 type:complete len:171 (-) Transcript_8890:133-645(-)